MTDSFVIAYLPKLKEFEGNVPWMYLDGNGNVTVGVGFLVPSVLYATSFPFYLPGLQMPATAQEITAAYNQVSGMQEGRLPSFYDYHGALQLQQTWIDSHLQAILDQTVANLQRDYTGFDGFPDSVKMALCDLDYNLGDAKLRNTYPHFDLAIDQQNWKTAAAQCHRNGVSADRNLWCAEQFLAVQ